MEYCWPQQVVNSSCVHTADLFRGPSVLALVDGSQKNKRRSSKSTLRLFSFQLQFNRHKVQVLYLLDKISLEIPSWKWLWLIIETLSLSLALWPVLSWTGSTCLSFCSPVTCVQVTGSFSDSCYHRSCVFVPMFFSPWFPLSTLCVSCLFLPQLCLFCHIS